MLFCFAPLMLPAGVVALLFAFVSIWRRRVHDLPLERGVCARCKYPLAGLRRNGDEPQAWVRCPECGEESWGLARIGREPLAWGWWAAVGLVGAGAVAAAADAHAGSSLSHAVGLEAALLIPSIATTAGFIAQVMSIVLTNHVRRGERAGLLIALGVLQIVASITWTLWEFRVMEWTR